MGFDEKREPTGGRLRLQDIPALTQDHCRMRDPAEVERIINEFVIGGPERMQIVSDFDYTITKQRTEDGGAVPSSFGIFNACQSLPENFKAETDKLYHKYRPIEIDPHMPIAEKVQYMIEWWTKSGELTSGFPFDQSEIDQIASKYTHALRDRTHEFFADLQRLGIPTGPGNHISKWSGNTHVQFLFALASIQKCIRQNQRVIAGVIQQWSPSWRHHDHQS